MKNTALINIKNGERNNILQLQVTLANNISFSFKLNEYL